MHTTTQMDRITRLDDDQVRHFIAMEATEAELHRYWGPYTAAVRNLARAPEAARKRGDSLIILLPGLMGTSLEDRGDHPQLLWVNPLAYARGEVNRLEMAEDGQRDVTPGVKVKPRNLLWLVYARLLLRLQKEYEIHTFPYDWRRFTWDTAPLLKDFIDQKLSQSRFDKVTLVGHSLGGLVSMDYLIGEGTRAHAEKHVRRLVTLGTPFRGALLSVIALARGDDPKLNLLRSINSGNDPLRMLRSFPSMYEILPAPSGCYPDWNPLPKVDIWDPTSWEHQNVKINRQHLISALEHHEQLSQADPQVPVYCVAGALVKTILGINGDLLQGEVDERWEGALSGDGTVATASAQFTKSVAYYVHEVHTELVLERTVIDGIADWVDGGEPHNLVKRIDDVVRMDLPGRGAMAAEAQAIEVDPQEIAAKAHEDEPLDYDELRALQSIF